MRILKILSVFILIYFIKRFMEMYQVMKRVQEQQELLKRQNPAGPQAQNKNTNVIDADFKVMD